MSNFICNELMCGQTNFTMFFWFMVYEKTMYGALIVVNDLNLVFRAKDEVM